jgi:cyclopropane-fatty-acyl-phospholipid synthase
MFGTLLKHGLKYGRITLVDHRGRRATYGGEGPTVTLRLHDSSVGREVALNPWLKVGEAYMDGRLTIEDGTLYDFMDIGLANTVQLTGVWTQKFTDVANRMLRWWHQNNPIARSRENVAHHYDLSRKLFSLFLDESMQYSCGYWPKLDMSLSEAQQAKMRHIASKLLLEPGQLVLDIGCGWGALGIYLAKTAGVKIIGVTLSKEQLDIAKQRAQKAGLEGQVEFRLQDYREVPERFDRIVSVGMFEHVGIKQYPVFFRQAEKLLKPAGAMLLHAIGRRDGPGYTNPWLRKYIFPGGYSPALSEVLPWIEKTGLWVTDIEILRLHYAETLKAWRANFEKHRAEIRALYDERFCRMWEFYLIGSELSFRYDYNMVFQIQMARNINTVPITRDYMFDWERKESARAFPPVPWKQGQAAE